MVTRTRCARRHFSTACYAEAQDFWDRLVDTSSTLGGRMTDIRIVNNNPDGTYMESANEVRIADGLEETRNITALSHELGHAATAHSLNLSDLDYPFTCDDTHTYTQNLVCERMAWVEGIANFYASARAWNGDAGNNAIWFLGSQPLELVTVNTCSGADDWRVEACQTAALWDLYDDPLNDDDPIDDSDLAIGHAGISNVLNAYSDGCWPIDDRCSNENGEHGLNHFDFLFNFDALFGGSGTMSADLRSIYSALDLNDGGEEPWN